MSPLTQQQFWKIWLQAQLILALTRISRLLSKLKVLRQAVLQLFWWLWYSRRLHSFLSFLFHPRYVAVILRLPIMVARQLLQLKISHPPVTTFKSQKKRRGKQELLPVQPLLFFFKSEVKLFFLCPLLLLLLSLFSHVRLCGPPWTAASQASIYRILQARMLEWVAMPCSRGSFQSGIQLRPPALQADSLPLSHWGAHCALPVQFSPVAQSCPTLCDPMDCSTPGLPAHHQLPEFTQTHVHWVSDAIQPSHPLSSPSPPSFNLSQFRVFSSESVLHIRRPNYWSFSFSISPSNEYFGLISFRMDWLDLLAVQGTIKSLLQHRSTKPSILWYSAFFIVQLSYPYMTTGKTIPLTRQTFVGKGVSLLFNMLSRLDITFPPRSKHLLISWLQSPSAVILEPKKVKSVMVSIVSPSVCREVMGPDAMILVSWMLSFKQTLSLSSFTFIKRLFNSSLLSTKRVVSSAYLLLIFLPAWF